MLNTINTFFLCTPQPSISGCLLILKWSCRLIRKKYAYFFPISEKICIFSLFSPFWSYLFLEFCWPFFWRGQTEKYTPPPKMSLLYIQNVFIYLDFFDYFDLFYFRSIEGKVRNLKLHPPLNIYKRIISHWSYFCPINKMKVRTFSL